MDRKLILYGAGQMGRYMGPELVLRDIPVECFCDRDEKKCGRNFCGYAVKTIDEVKSTYPKGSFRILLTLARKQRMEVKRGLIEDQVFEEEDFYEEEEDPLGIMPLFLSFSMDVFALADCIPDESQHMLENNYRCLDEKREEMLKASLLKNYYHTDCLDLTSRAFQEDFDVQMYRRLDTDRKLIIPWLNSIQCLRGASVLEIGCGTGISTVALSEQGASVTAIDVDDDSLKVAGDRMDYYGLSAEFLHMNADRLSDELPGRHFDFVIFFASLEHMTFRERIRAIREAFRMVDNGGHVVLVEIPNRLWYFDRHTSKEPFYNWLPDELAMEYAKNTSREGFNQGFDPENENDVLRFARWGRGVSYHEFEIALGGWEQIHVESSLNSYLKVPDNRFKEMLRLVGPEGLHDGFYDETLYLSLSLEASIG